MFLRGPFSVFSGGNIIAKGDTDPPALLMRGSGGFGNFEGAQSAVSRNRPSLAGHEGFQEPVDMRVHHSTELPVRVVKKPGNLWHFVEPVCSSTKTQLQRGTLDRLRKGRPCLLAQTARPDSSKKPEPSSENGFNSGVVAPPARVGQQFSHKLLPCHP